MEDEQLVKRIVEGDKEALAELYERWFDKVWRFCYWQVGNREEAEDLTEEVFLKMIKSLKSWEKRGSFKSWLWGIARNTVKDFFRKKYRLKTVRLEDWMTREEKKPAKSFKKEVAALLAKLPERYQQVLRLRFLRGYTLKEVAVELGVSLANAKVLQYRAIKKLQQLEVR